MSSPWPAKDNLKHVKRKQWPQIGRWPQLYRQMRENIIKKMDHNLNQLFCKFNGRRPQF